MSEAARLPAHIEVAGLIRSVQAQGGFAAVLKRGDQDGGSILLVLTENGTNTRLFERMPQLDGSRKWLLARTQDTDNPSEFTEYLDRRGNQDRDLWIIELDIAEGERLIG